MPKELEIVLFALVAIGLTLSNLFDWLFSGLSWLARWLFWKWKVRRCLSFLRKEAVKMSPWMRERRAWEARQIAARLPLGRVSSFWLQKMSLYGEDR